MVFNSRLMHPLFTRLVNLLQNALSATRQMQLRSPEREFQNNRYRVFAGFSLLFQSNDDKHYDSTLRLPESTNNRRNTHNVKNRTHCLHASVTFISWQQPE